MLNKIVTVGAIAVSALTGGCLQQETSHSFYIAPDGGVSWVISEENVQSNEADNAARIDEEQRYVSGVLLGTHATARELNALGPQEPVRTILVRDQRPFHVVTDARFDRIDHLLERLFEGAGVNTAAALLRNGTGTTLTVILDCGTDVPVAQDAALDRLLEIDRFRFVLVEGNFDGASGFNVTHGNTAMFSAGWLASADEACGQKRSVQFALSWRY